MMMMTTFCFVPLFRGFINSCTLKERFSYWKYELFACAALLQRE